ncbi:hypothetical protein [Polaromonas sp.]|uniref:hypothetical protein n=1 Tax=Polaromonas sp. TaxID=1869339 RepID=UPI00272F056C|nr:hypothetical protein [Polaromonas sp.]MDP1742390.1 hypothetical protein [Polaromonas sp.]
MDTEILKVTGMKRDGLFRLAQSRITMEQFLPAHGVPGEPGMQAVTSIASVPLDDRSWQLFAEGEVVVVAAGIVTHGSAAC